MTSLGHTNNIAMTGEWIRPLCGISVNSTCTIGNGQARHPYADCPSSLDFGMSFI